MYPALEQLLPRTVLFCVGDHETPPQYTEGSIFDFLHYQGEVSSGTASLIEMYESLLLASPERDIVRVER